MATENKKKKIQPQLLQATNYCCNSFSADEHAETETQISTEKQQNQQNWLASIKNGIETETKAQWLTLEPPPIAAAKSEHRKKTEENAQEIMGQLMQ